MMVSRATEEGGEWSMWRLVRGRAIDLPRRRNRRGQSILEYVVIATVIVLAIFAIKGTVDTNVRDMYGKAVDKTANAANMVDPSTFQVQTAN